MTAERLRGRGLTGTVWRRAMAGLMGLSVLVSAVSAAPEAHAAPDSDYDIWVRAVTGVGFADAVSLGTDDGFGSVALATDVGAAPLLSVGLHFRVSRFDLGLTVDAMGGGTFLLPGRDVGSPLGGLFRAAASVRWRYVDQPWGALCVRLSPGYALAAHSDAVRSQAALLAQGTGFRDADTVTHGFVIGFELSLLVYVADGAALSIGADFLTATGPLRVGSGAGAQVLTYIRARALVTAGMEFGL